MLPCMSIPQLIATVCSAATVVIVTKTLFYNRRHHRATGRRVTALEDLLAIYSVRVDTIEDTLKHPPATLAGRHWDAFRPADHDLSAPPRPRPYVPAPEHSAGPSTGPLPVFDSIRLDYDRRNGPGAFDTEMTRQGEHVGSGLSQWYDAWTCGPRESAVCPRCGHTFYAPPLHDPLKHHIDYCDGEAIIDGQA